MWKTWKVPLKNYGKVKNKALGLYYSSRGTGVTARSREKDRDLRRIDEELTGLGPVVLSSFEDRRSHDYGQARPAKAIYGVQSRYQVIHSPRRLPDREKIKKNTVERIGFMYPRRVIICAKRRMRREVLHAHRRTGHGAGTRYRIQKPKYNEYSEIVC